MSNRIVVATGSARFIDAGRHGRIEGQCPENLTDHQLVHGTIEIAAVPLFNPGFENGFRQWSVWSPEPGYEAPVVPFGREGLSGALQHSAAGFIWRDLRVTSSREYDITAWVRCYNGSAQRMLSVHDTAGGGYQESAYACSADKWTELRLRHRANQTGQVRIHFVRSPGTGWVLWDSLNLALVDN